MNKIFVVGGAGYIGTHTVLSLLKSDYEVVVFDNLEYGNLSMLDKVQELANKKLTFIKGDIKNYSEILAALGSSEESFDAVIHFAAYKSVVESYSEPLRYYENNVGGSINLIKAMKEKGVKNIIFSSTAAVYGQAEKLPISESSPINPMSVYAKTKVMVENVLEDAVREGINSIRLRYFNVAGADFSGEIGEDPNCLGNLIPRLFTNLIGKHDLRIYGNNYPTRDGYQIRDYIHVTDLAEAHVLAMKHLMQNPGTVAINLGTGEGTTVKELIDETDKVTGKRISFEIIESKPGEPIELYADPTLAEKLLGWKAKYNYHEIISSAWNWYKRCPEFKDIG
jgi:UDP-glucose 4-epimerase